jgi:hypothetical protein
VGEIALFPGVAVVPAVEDECAGLNIIRVFDLLARWAVFGEEIKRRVEQVPFDLQLELYDLLVATREV